MIDFFTHNPLWIERAGKIYALLERVKISCISATEISRTKNDPVNDPVNIDFDPVNDPVNSFDVLELNKTFR